MGILIKEATTRSKLTDPKGTDNGKANRKKTNGANGNSRVNMVNREEGSDLEWPRRTASDISRFILGYRRTPASASSRGGTPRPPIADQPLTQEYQQTALLFAQVFPNDRFNVRYTHRARPTRRTDVPLRITRGLINDRENDSGQSSRPALMDSRDGHERAQTYIHNVHVPDSGSNGVFRAASLSGNIRINNYPVYRTSHGITTSRLNSAPSESRETDNMFNTQRLSEFDMELRRSVIQRLTNALDEGRSLSHESFNDLRNDRRSVEADNSITFWEDVGDASPASHTELADPLGRYAPTLGIAADEGDSLARNRPRPWTTYPEATRYIMSSIQRTNSLHRPPLSNGLVATAAAIEAAAQEELILRNSSRPATVELSANRSITNQVSTSEPVTTQAATSATAGNHPVTPESDCTDNEEIEQTVDERTNILPHRNRRRTRDVFEGREDPDF